MKFSSRNVVFPARRKDIDYQGLLDCGSAVLHASADNENVSRAQVKCFAETIHFQMSTHNVDDLIVRMAVHRSTPAFQHVVLGEEKLVVVGEHATCEP